MAESSQVAMTEEGVSTEDTSTCKYFTVGDMVFATCGAEEAPILSILSRVSCLVSRVQVLLPWSSVEVHFGVLSQVP